MAFCIYCVCCTAWYGIEPVLLFHIIHLLVCLSSFLLSLTCFPAGSPHTCPSFCRLCLPWGLCVERGLLCYDVQRCTQCFWELLQGQDHRDDGSAQTDCCSADHTDVTSLPATYTLAMSTLYDIILHSLVRLFTFYCIELYALVFYKMYNIMLCAWHIQAACGCAKEWMHNCYFRW